MTVESNRPDHEREAAADEQAVAADEAGQAQAEEEEEEIKGRY